MAGLIGQAQALEKALKGSVMQLDRLTALNLFGGFSAVGEITGLQQARTSTPGVGSRSTGGVSAEEAGNQARERQAARQRKFDEAFVAGNEGIRRQRGRQFDDLLAQQIIDAINRLNGTLDRDSSRTGGGL